MKLLFTRRYESAEEILTTLGHEVVVRAVEDNCDLEDWDNPEDFKLHQVVLDEGGVDAVILLDPVVTLPNGEQFVYRREHVLRLNNHRIPCVLWPRDDPATLSLYRNRRVRSCGARTQHCKVYCSPDREAAASVSRNMPSVWWNEGANADKLIAAIEWRKGYSSKRDAARFLGA